jgi:hypothetical protein
MNESELSAFEKVEGWRECLEVRKWDDQAKLVGIERQTPRTASYKDMIASVLERDGALLNSIVNETVEAQVCGG